MITRMTCCWLLTLLSCTVLAQQSNNALLQKHLEDMQVWFYSHNPMSAAIQYSYYEQCGADTPTDTFTERMYRNDDQYLAEKKMIDIAFNGREAVVVNKQDKTMYIKRQDSLPLPHQSLIGKIDDILTAVDDFEIEPINDNLQQLNLEFSYGDYDRLQIVYHADTYAIDKVVLWFAGNNSYGFSTQSCLVLSYTITETLDKEIARHNNFLERYFTRGENGLQCTPEYADYEFITY